MIYSTQSPPKQEGSEKSTITIKIKKSTVKPEKVPAQWRPRTNQAHKCSSYLISYYSFPTLLNPETENPSPPFSRENPNFETFPENPRIQSSKSLNGEEKKQEAPSPPIPTPSLQVGTQIETRHSRNPKLVRTSTRRHRFNPVPTRGRRDSDERAVCVHGLVPDLQGPSHVAHHRHAQRRRFG